MKLALGTVQFGLDYGVANKKGKTAKEEVFKILEYAYTMGIDILDTAYSYGRSENVIGEFIAKSGRNFKIISKMPHLNNDSILTIRKNCLETLNRLRQSKIYGYLIHKFNNTVYHREDLWNKIEFLKQDGLVDKIGFSLYKPEELEIILDSKLEFDILQIPYSVFDRRFERYFPILKKRNTEIYVRSVFLQGLAFFKPANLPKNLIKAQEYLKILHTLVLENAITVNALCINFVLLNPHIDKAIMGVDSLGHLESNIEAMNVMEKVKDIYDKLDDLKIENEDLILPYNWSL